VRAEPAIAEIGLNPLAALDALLVANERVARPEIETV
jgi:hypothetical protein